MDSWQVTVTPWHQAKSAGPVLDNLPVLPNCDPPSGPDGFDGSLPAEAQDRADREVRDVSCHTSLAACALPLAQARDGPDASNAAIPRPLARRRENHQSNPKVELVTELLKLSKLLLRLQLKP